MAGPADPSPTAPTEPTTAQAESLLLRAIRRYQGQLALRTLATRAVLLLAAGLAMPLLVVAADHWLSGGVPQPLLAASQVAWWGGLTLSFLLVLVLTLFRRLSPLFVARQLERFAEIRHNSLVNALLLRRSPTLTYAQGAALQQAAQDLRRGDWAATGPGIARGYALALLAVVVLWGLYMFLAPKPVGPSVQRFLGADLDAPTATRLELVQPGPDEAPHAGEALTMAFAVHGRPVREVRLDILDEDDPHGPPRRRFVSTESVGAIGDRRQFVLAPFDVDGDVLYRCTAGDAELAGRIPVEPQPALAGLEIQLDPPAYSDWPRSEPDEPDLQVLAGTRATFTITANTPIAEAVFIFREAGTDDETRTRMRTDADDTRQARLSLVLLKEGTYAFAFSDPWAYRFETAEVHHIEIVPDNAPRVRITVPDVEHVPDDRVDVQQWPAVVAVAADDLGVDRVMLVTQQTGPPRRVALALPAGLNRTEFPVRVRPAVLDVDWTAPVRLWFEVADGRVLPDGRPAPQAARSRTLTLVGTPRLTDADATGEGNAGGEQGTGREGGSAEGDAGGGETGVDVQGVSDEGGGQQGDREGDGEDDRASGEQAPEESDAPQQRDGVGDAADEPTRPEDSDGAGDAADDARRELDEFVRKHGDEAAEVCRRKGECEGDGQSEGEQGAGEGAGGGADGHQEQQPGQGAPAEDEAGDQPGQENEGSDPQAGAEAEEPADEGAADNGGATDQPGAQEAADSSGKKGADATPGEPQDGGGAQPGEREQSGDARQPGAENQGADATDATAPTSQPTDPAAAGERDPNEPGDRGAVDEDHPPAVAEDPSMDDPQAPLAPPPAPDAGAGLPGSTGMAETIDLLEMLDRGESIDAAMLIEMGWPAAKAAAFVQALARLHEATQPIGGAAALRRLDFDTRVGDAARAVGLGFSAELQRAREAARGTPDDLRRIAPPAEQHVPARLRALLDAYYRSVAQAAGAATSDEDADEPVP